MTRRGRWALGAALTITTAAVAVGAVRERGKLTGTGGAAVAAPGITTEKGLQFRLSEGRPLLGGNAETVPAGETTPLSDADADRVLARLKAVGVQAGDTQNFALREGSLPPPRAGQTITAKFPPPPTEGAPPVVETGPLTVRRVQPEGDVSLADRVSVTFSQPMIPITSQEDAAKNVPVQLTPAVPGTWRWLGTQTLIFDAGSGKRLPMATSFRLTIPAGTKSQTGGGAALAAEKTVTFQTPAVRLLHQWPAQNTLPQAREPVLWVAFDQQVDPDAVVKTITLQARGKKYAVCLAADKERAGIKELHWYRNIPADRTVAFKPLEPLPANTDVSVAIGPGTPSLEGPRKTDSPQFFSFRTYGPFQLISAYGGGEPSGSSWNLEFNNAIDEDAFDPATIKVAPAVPGLHIEVSGSYLNISGATKGRTTYTVTVPAALKDSFGQTLGKPVTKTFKVGPATPYLAGPQQSFVVCDPGATPRAVFHSVNTPSAKIRIYTVSESDWPAWLTYVNRGRQDKGVPPGRLVREQTVPLKTEADTWGETSVPLNAALQNGRGNVIVQWESPIRRNNELPDRGAVWFQATTLGLMAQRDATDLYAWVTNLSTGNPVSGATAELVGGGRQAVKTGSDGLAQLVLSDQPGKRLVVRHGGDTAFLPSSQWAYNDASWQKRGQGDEQRWFIFDDRKLYRPGETAHVKGWVRVQKAGKTGDLALPTGLSSVSWSLSDARGNEVRKGVAPLNAWAGFDLALELPKTMNLGQAVVRINGGNAAHYFNVEEFRRPEFEVTAKNEGAGPFVIADPKGADLSVSAKYYAGGALPGTPVTWSVSAFPTSYTPPGREEFTFGKWTPWWGIHRDEDFSEGGFGGRYRPGDPGGAEPPQTFAGRTGGDGTHYLHLDFDSVRPAQPYTVSAQAVIQDVNRQTRAANASLLVHPSERYVGLKGRNLFIEKGKKLAIDALVCDIDGKTDAGRKISFQAARKEWTYKKGRWREEETDTKAWTETSGSEPLTTEFTPTEGGQWVVRATVLDDKERANESELTLWVSGGSDGPKNKQRNLGQETATLIPSAKEYKAGDTATILVQSPFENAEGLATIVHDGIVKIERFTMKGSAYTLNIPIAETFLPSVGVQVELVGAEARTDEDGKAIAGVAKRPAFASGHLDLSVPPTSRKLTVTASPAESALPPGGKTTVTVSIKDAAGKPVANAEAAVVVVDESVLALAGWNLGDPLAALYPGRETNVETSHLRQFVLLEDPAKVSAAVANGRGFGGGASGAVGRMVTLNAAAPMSSMAAGSVAADRDENFGFAKRSDMGRARGLAEDKSVAAPAQADTPIALRTNFNALAEFAPSVKTDSDGTARVPVTLPDNLTRYRIVVVAVAGGKQIGHGEAALTARLPLMARPSAPRFLNFGDKFDLPIVLQNQTDTPMTVEVAVRGTNLAFTRSRGQRVTVKANDRVEVRFPAEAILPGTARFQVAAISADRADAAELSLPVWTPATTEAFATYGVIDKGAVVQPVQTPGDVVTQFGGLEVTTSSTALQELTDAVIYLAKYPYGCAEQISSRVLATAALKDVLAAFKTAEMPKPEEMNAAMARDLARLAEMQSDDGGFGFWSRYTEQYPYLGVHVAHALVRAKLKGFAVPEPLYGRSMSYIKNIESKFPSHYDAETRRMITAYALYVRHLAGDTDTARAKKLLNETTLDKLGPETVGWLLNILAGDRAMASARTWLNNKATETAGAAHFTFSYNDNSYLVLSSDRRADAIVLDALIADQPKSDLIPKLVRGLLDGRKRGHWSGTQENAFVLLALDRYFRTYEGVTPNFVARLWLGEKLAGEGVFKGRSTNRVESQIPMAYLAKTTAAQNLTLSKDGAGRLYYRVGMRYAPKNLNLKAADYGFTVRRTYEPIDKPADVRREADGTWVIRAGAKVRVRLTMIATTRRYHVALTDPLPAGFESLNSELQGTESVEREVNVPRVEDGGRYDYNWGWSHWWEHENLRDERAEAFTPYLWEGAYEYVYICRATTPGQYIVPPAKAEEMYAPETFGRSSSDRVRVE